MNLQRILNGWRRLADLEWQEIRAGLPDLIARAASNTKRAHLDGWFATVAFPVLTEPSRARPEVRPLAPLLEEAVVDLQRDHERYERVTTVAVGLLDLGNALECVGVALAPASWATMRGWLPRMEVSRNDVRAADWWTAAFAALALDEPLRFRKAAALTPDEPNPFVAGATFEFNMQALLRHLAGAIATGATFEDVQPAWENLLLRYGDMRGDASVDEGTLLWIARLVFHRIGGRPLGEVAQALHDSAWSLAGLDP